MEIFHDLAINDRHTLARRLCLFIGVDLTAGEGLLELAGGRPLPGLT